MVRIVGMVGMVGVVRKVAIYTVPIQPAPDWIHEPENRQQWSGGFPVSRGNAKQTAWPIIAKYERGYQRTSKYVICTVKEVFQLEHVALVLWESAFWGLFCIEFLPWPTRFTLWHWKHWQVQRAIDGMIQEGWAVEFPCCTVKVMIWGYTAKWGPLDS